MELGLFGYKIVVIEDESLFAHGAIGSTPDSDSGNRGSSPCGRASVALAFSRALRCEGWVSDLVYI